MNILEAAKQTREDIKNIKNGVLPTAFLRCYDIAFYGWKLKNMPAIPEYKRLDFWYMSNNISNPFDLKFAEYSTVSEEDDSIDELTLFIEYGNYAFRIVYDIREFAKFYVNHYWDFKIGFQLRIQQQLTVFYFNDLISKDEFIKKRIKVREFLYNNGDFQKFKDCTITYFKELTRINKYILNN